MKVFVGTSGWFYEWNEERTLDWYLAHSGLNTVELNASFYRFPFPNQVNAWAKKSKGRLRWAIKVNRRITHLGKFASNTLDIWASFTRLFAPLDSLIDFYLFQVPPSISPGWAGKLAKFFRKIALGERAAVEFRLPDWFRPEWIDWAKALGLTLVSVDAPDLPREILMPQETVYLRFHGRIDWYRHNYTSPELKEVVARVKMCYPQKVYAYFNNNHNMLTNAQTFYKLLLSR